MDLNSYFAPLIKWWWLPLIAAIIAAISTLIATTGQPSTYESRTTLMVGRSLENPNPSSTTFYFEQELAKIYADMAKRGPIREATMAALGLQQLPDYVVSALPNTQLIEITVSATDPRLAQAVAAELANQLINRTPTSSDSQDQEQQAFIEEQLAQIQQDIETTESDIQRLKVQLGTLSGAREITDVERQIAALEEKRTTLRNTYASLRNSSQRAATNTLTIIEPAEELLEPTGPNTLLNVLLAGMLGAFVAAGGAYLIEFLDQRISNSKEASRLLGWPLLGEIEQMPTEGDQPAEINNQLFAIIASSFRGLRANLEVAGMGQSIKTLLVTSPAVSEGKSTIALNLALTLATADKKVILLDGDLHRSQMSYTDRKGLGDLLLEGGSAREYLISPYKNQLSILPAGKTPRKAIGLLDTSHMQRILNDLKEVAEVIVIDGPPTFVSDALVFAASVDGVLTVVRLGRSPRDAIAKMKAQLQVTSAKVLGIVINGIAERPAYQYGYYNQAMFMSQPNGIRMLWMKLQGRLKKFRLSPGRKADGGGPSKTPV